MTRVIRRFTEVGYVPGVDYLVECIEGEPTWKFYKQLINDRGRNKIVEIIYPPSDLSIKGCERGLQNIARFIN